MRLLVVVLEAGPCVVNEIDEEDYGVGLLEEGDVGCRLRNNGPRNQKGAWHSTGEAR